MTIREILHWAINRLEHSSHSPTLDAEMVLCDLLQVPRTFIITHADEKVSLDVMERYKNHIHERQRGKPIAYLIGKKEFWGKNFLVNPHVLIPRSETELLMEKVIDYVHHTFSDTSNISILDIGTGSGCISISLACEFPHTKIIATDIDAQALHCATKNATRFHQPIRFFQGDGFDALPSSMHNFFQIIVSNPPYVHKTHVHMKNIDEQGLAFEPSHALFSTTYPPKLIIDIVQHANDWLASTPCGIFIEIGNDLGLWAQHEAQKYFPNALVTVEKDLSGYDRLLCVLCS